MRMRVPATASEAMTFALPPSSVKVLKEKSDGASAQYRCRLWLEEYLGPNRLGGTGLE